jgi:hypothetical protein
MKTATLHSAQAHEGSTRPSKFVPLDIETRPAVDTAAAAYYLNRRPQTLRSWASTTSGPLRPIRVNGRLGWPLAEIRKLLGVA